MDHIGYTGELVIVILEGPDGSGKTTLAQYLQRKGYKYHHEGPPPLGAEPLLWHYGRVLDSFRGQDVVIDRLALGECIYGPVVRGIDRLGEEGWRVFTRLALAVGACEIVCLPPPETCFENWRDRRGELFVQPAQLYEVYSRYAHVVLSDPGRYVVWDYTRISPEELTHGLRERPVLPRGLVGSPFAHYLLIGQQVGDVTGIDLPFFAATGSASYLTGALRLAGIDDVADVAYVNVFDAAGRLVEFPTTNAAGEVFEIVALGQVAARRCTLLGLHHRRVRHPQYWKRFKFTDVKGYARALRGARC